jgi:hypothetical protein
MHPSTKLAPIVIGGSGGSGTRVVAEILIRSGVYLGCDLNKSNDNLLFTYFFKRSNLILGRGEQRVLECKRLFTLHERLLFGHPPTLREWGLILKAGLEHALDLDFYGWRWVLQRWSNMMWGKVATSASSLWGWKEPNSMFFLREIRNCYPKAKYILLLRNGLDMAYSDNSQQLENWGSYFEVDPNDSSPLNRFEYWYRSNLEAVDTLQTLYDDDFLIIRFEDLCLDKSSTIRELISFAGLDCNEAKTTIWNIPQLPNSHGRYRRFDTNWINQETKDKLAEIGYSLESICKST